MKPWKISDAKRAFGKKGKKKGNKEENTW